MDRRAHRAVEQRRRETAVNDADRVVVLLAGLGGEDDASLLDLGQREVEQPLDRSGGQLLVADRHEEVEAGHDARLLAQGREDLARAALERKTVAQTELQSLDSQIEQLASQQEQLTANEKKLRAKIEAFRTKKEVIKAQYSAAEAQVKISEAANGVGEEMADLGLAIQRAEDKTEEMRARAGAVEELEAAGTFDDLSQLGGGQDDIDRELAQLGASGQVDDELAAMKAELGSGGGESPQLGNGEESK